MNNLNAAAEKMKHAQDIYAYECNAKVGQAQAIGLGCDIQQPSRRLSLREEAEKQVGLHREQADRADRCAAFFREHPEFDEFIQLIRSGVISI